MGKISGSHCLVMGCRNRQLLNQTNSRSYFRFPRDPEMCKQWVDFCNRPELWKKYEENGPEYLYKSSRICSDHFQSSDFNNPNLFSQGLKKGSVPTLYPASKEPKNRYSISAISGVSGIGLTGGSVVSGGGGGSTSPPTNNSNSNHSDSDSLALPLPTKRPLLSQPSAQQPVAKHRRLLPPALSTTVNTASVSGALAGLIQRQQLKEQQRKAMAAALQLHQRQHAQNQQAARSLLESLKLRPNPNNNNHISSNNNNNNHHHNNNNKNSSSKSAAASPGKYEDEQGYGINYVDMDGGDSSEYDQNSLDEEISAYKHMQTLKAIKAAAAVIPASLQGELTVTPAVIHSSSSGASNKASSNSNSVSTSSSTNGTINYKEKYEQTLKELFACRKIVKNQNNAIRQLQTEIDFLTQLLKEK